MNRLFRWSARDQGALEAILGAALLVVVVFGLALPAANVLGFGPGGSTSRIVELDEPASVPRLPAGADVTLEGTSEASSPSATPARASASCSSCRCSSARRSRWS